MENLDLRQFWKGKRVLVTGHSGFKGSWLTLWLEKLGAKVIGIGLPPTTTPSLFVKADIAAVCESRFCDIRDRVPFSDQIRAADPQIVFHLAAQPLVRASYREPVETFATNVMGTVHLLDALRALSHIRVVVMVTTDKVYRYARRAYREDDALGGDDPYGASKAASELVITSYRQAFLAERGIAVASARAGNVIGGGDWSDDRLIPDAVRAWQEGDVLEIRFPNAVRPWQHVLEPLSGYLSLAEALWHKPGLAGAYNFGPDANEATTVRSLIELAQSAYGTGDILYKKGFDGPHEAPWLALDNTKAKKKLGITPILDLSDAVIQSMTWYKAFGKGSDARQLCNSDIAEYERRRCSRVPDLSALA